MFGLGSVVIADNISALMRDWGAMGGLELTGGLKGQQSVSPRQRLGSLYHVTIRPDGAKE